MRRSSFPFALLVCAPVGAGPPNGVWSNFTQANFRARDPPRFQIALCNAFHAGAASSAAFNRMPTPDKTPLPPQAHRRAGFAARI